MSADLKLTLRMETGVSSEWKFEVDMCRWRLEGAETPLLLCATSCIFGVDLHVVVRGGGGGGGVVSLLLWRIDTSQLVRVSAYLSDNPTDTGVQPSPGNTSPTSLDGL